MCGVCGKKVNDAATLRKHVKVSHWLSTSLQPVANQSQTHLDSDKGESVTPSKRKGGPMSK